MASSSKEFEGILYLLGLGGFFFYTGFRKLVLRRKALGLATSKARSMAMGTVELSGIAVKNTELSDPIFKEPCVYFNIKVEERRRSGKRSHWVTVHQEQSDGIGFFCQDTTGKVLVLPRKPELHFANPIVLRGGSINTTLFTTKAAPATSPNVAYLARWGGNTRITAHILRAGDPVYVIGCALPTRAQLIAEAPKVPDVPGSISMAANVKKDAARMKAMDTNQDGHVDAMEWEQGLASYKRFLEMKHAHETELAKEDHLKKVTVTDPLEFSGMVTRTDECGLVLAHSEDDLVKRLGTWAFIGVIGGGAAFTLGLILLLQKLL